MILNQFIENLKEVGNTENNVSCGTDRNGQLHVVVTNGKGLTVWDYDFTIGDCEVEKLTFSDVVEGSITLTRISYEEAIIVFKSCETILDKFGETDPLLTTLNYTYNSGRLSLRDQTDEYENEIQ